MMFRIGDKVVYPGHGVGEVVAIESREMMGSRMDVYVLRILDKGMTIIVPVAKSDEVGLREVMGGEEIDRVFHVLRERKRVSDGQTWNRRFRAYSEKIRTGSALEIAKVLRDLYLLRAGKSLSYGEKRMLNTAMELLAQEIAVASGEPPQRAEARILSAFSDVAAKPEG